MMSFFDTCSLRGSTFVIAEVGANHDGSFDEARYLLDVAARAGADAVKFQSFLADFLVGKDNADYEVLKKLQMPQDWYAALSAEAAQRGLKFFSTASNEITLGWLRECSVELYKLASPNLTHLPLIRKVAEIGKPVIMSTGMASVQQIDEAVQTFLASGNRELCLLHCVSEYPTNPAAVNLRFIETLRELYPFAIGFSDHTLDIGSAIAAVALGAKVVEKHITRDRSRRGPDHGYALESDDFVRMVRNIRAVELALGSRHRVLSAVEQEKSFSYWRSLHAAVHLPAGTVLSADHIAIVRPNDGLHSRHFEDVVGMRLLETLQAGEPITWKAFRDGPSD
jgi:N,N'-diacetyllegionaminate synthase